MTRKYSHMLAALVISASASVAEASEFKGRDNLISIDLSDSVPQAKDDNYAKLVAQKIYDIVRNTRYGDRIRMRSFGSYDTAKNPLRYDRVMSRRARPRIVSRQLYHMVSRIPAMVRSGKLKTQNSTHIIAFLNDMAPSMRCSATKPGSVVLFTDGVESSRRTQINIRTGKITLPKPKPGLYQHCHFYIYGAGQLGAASDERITESITAAWEAWAKQAGFTKIQIMRVW